MSLDLDRKDVVRNAYRVTCNRNETCLRVRVPGGHIQAEHLTAMRDIAQTYGNGTVHLTSRQGFEIPGIDYADIATVNRAIADYIRDSEVALGVEIDEPTEGYPAAGTRNISACIGSRVCPFANADTTSLAQKLEAATYPSHRHVKIAVTGCANDCAKTHLQDFGIIALSLVEFDEQRCIGCEACEQACRQRVTQAITMHNGRAVRDARRCIGCGECVVACPVNAWTRHPVPRFRVLVLGRTGKRNPRLAAPFLEWVTEDVVLHIVKNAYGFIEDYTDKSLRKEHLGYIVDRVGYHTFRDALLAGITLEPPALVARKLHFNGYWYEPDRAFDSTAAP